MISEQARGVGNPPSTSGHTRMAFPCAARAVSSDVYGVEKVLPSYLHGFSARQELIMIIEVDSPVTGIV